MLGLASIWIRTEHPVYLLNSDLQTTFCFLHFYEIHLTHIYRRNVTFVYDTES